MILNLAQTKFVGLTMKLDLKAREYKTLCNKLDAVKKEKIDSNHERLYELLGDFKKNHDEIVDIKRQLKEIGNMEEVDIKEYNETYKYDDLFKQHIDNKNNKSNSSSDKMMIKYKENLWEGIKKRIKKLFRL